MTLSVECPTCRKKFEVSEENAGLRLKCDECESLIAIPQSGPKKTTRPEENVLADKASEKTWRVSGERLLRIVLSLVIVAGIGVVVALIMPPVGTKPNPDEGERTLGSPKNGSTLPTSQVDSRNHSSRRDEIPPAEHLTDEAIGVMRTLRAAATTGEISVPMLQRRIQEFAPQYPELLVSSMPGKPVWNTVRVNTSKTGFCVIRFQSPLSTPADMFLTFAYPSKAVAGWAILPVKGRMAGFRSSDQRDCLQFAEGKLPADNQVVSLRLLGGQIQPQAEYLVWFALRTEDPMDMQFAISLFPRNDENHQNVHSVEDIASLMGLTILANDFEPTPLGKAQALRYCSSQFAKAETAPQEEREPFKEFSTALRAVSSQFPEISPATGDQLPKWHRVVLNQTGVNIDAVQLTSPTDAPTHLSVAIVAPDAFRKWALLPVSEEEMVEPDYELSANVQVKGQKLSAQNVALFQHFPNLKIPPGRTYLLWFATWSDQPVPIHVALKLSAGGISKKRPSAAEIAAHMNVEVESPPLTESLPAVQSRAHRISMGRRNSDDIQRLVRSIPESFPLLDVTSDRSRPVFNFLEANPDNQYFTARRFRSPFAEPADLDILMVGSGATLIANIARLEAGANVTAFEQENLELESPRFKTPNLGVFQAIRGGPIQPGQDYFLWFAATQEKPAEIHVAVHLSPQNTSLEPNTPRAIGRAIGVQFPVSPGPEGSYVLGEHDDAVIAVQFDSEGKTLVSAGQDKHLHVWDIPSRQSSKEPVLPSRRILTFLKGGPQSQFLALATQGTRLQLVRLNEDQPLQEWPSPELPFRAAALSPDGKRLAICFADAGRDQGLLSIYDAQTGDETASRPIDGNLVYNGEFSADSNTLITVGGRFRPESPYRENSGQMTFWTAADLSRQHQLTQYMAFMTRLQMDDLGGHLATACHEGRLNVFNSKTRELLSSISQEGLTSCLRMTPDGTLVVFGCEDGRIRLWDWQNNRIWIELKGHSAKVCGLDVSPDSRWLASGSSDGTVRLWDLARLTSASPLDSNTAIITNSLGMKLAPIPAGQFRMGASPGDSSATNVENPPHRVTISKSFYLGQHEVTVNQFRQFVSATSYRTTAEQNGTGGTYFSFQTSSDVKDPNANWREPGFQEPGFQQTGNHPVVQVSWSDASAFCNWLSEKEGAKYRLPTEAEWEYACRAGSETRWSCSDRNWQLVSTANVSDLSLRRVYSHIDQYHPLDDGFACTAPVGHYLPNAFGLFDMHGNVAELCHDWYDSRSYTGFHRTDPQGPKEGRFRVIRGGGFHSRPSDVRSSRRDAVYPDFCRESVGFRVLRETP